MPDRIANAHQRSIAPIIMRWMFQRGISSNGKFRKIEREKENFSIFYFTLSEAEMNEINHLDTGKSLFLNRETPEAVATFKGFLKAR